MLLIPDPVFCHGAVARQGRYLADQRLASATTVFEKFDNKSSQCRVSLAHVLVIVDHNSEKATLSVLASVVVGFEVLVSAILH